MSLGSVLISMVDMWDRKCKGKGEVDDAINIKTEGILCLDNPKSWPREVLATYVVILFVDLRHLN